MSTPTYAHPAVVHSIRYETRTECFECEVLPALDERCMWRDELPTEEVWEELLDTLSGLCVSYVTDGVPADHGWDGEELDAPVPPGFYVTVSSDDFWNWVLDEALSRVTYYEVVLEDIYGRGHDPLLREPCAMLHEAEALYEEMLPRLGDGRAVYIAEVDGRGCVAMVNDYHTGPIA